MLLNKHVNNLLRGENYILFKHFLRNFNMLNDRMKRADYPARASVTDMLRDNLCLRMDREKPTNLEPFCYYTDGGTYNDNTKYFINNIFSRSGVCYSTKVPANTNVQAYLGRRID